MRLVLGVCAVYLVVSFGPSAMPAALAAGGQTIRVPSGGDLQAALNAAQPGDKVLLAQGGVYRGNFVLGPKSGTTFITVQTEISETGSLAAGVRLTPAAAAPLARIQSSNTMRALRTLPGAHHWRIQLVQFGPNDKGYGDIIELGDGSAAQNALSLVPYTLVLDRVYVYGDPLLGQKRGISINARDVTITNSTVRDIKGIGQDTQALCAYNGPGPFWIENNYLEASGENIMLGGADPSIPGLIPGGMTFRLNYVTKPLSWRGPILATPQNLSATVSAGGGIPPTTYTYQVVARRPAGQTTIAQSFPSAPVGVSLTALGRVSLSWTAVPTATEYRVYRRFFGLAEYWTVTQPAFTDTGADGWTAGQVPTAGTVWSVKNLFELKNAHDLLVERNIFENNWAESQVGYAIVLSVHNSGGACTWCTIQNVEFRGNVVRHTANAINILGYDDPSRPSVPAANFQIHDNLFYDIDSRWGGTGFFLQVGESPRNVVVDHNTIDHTGTVLISAYGGTPAAPHPIYGFRFTNNLSRHGTYGIFGAGLATGYRTITAYFPDGVIQRNLLSQGPPSKYPADNFFQPDFNTIFASTPTADYRLLPNSPFHLAGTDNKDLGAEMATLILTGPPSSTPPSIPNGLRVTVR